MRNGVLPLALDRAAINEIATANIAVTIDLPAQTVMLGDDHSWNFTIAEEAKAMLLEGLDAIDLSFKNTDSIAAWQQADRQARPWIYLGDPT